MYFKDETQQVEATCRVVDFTEGARRYVEWYRERLNAEARDTASLDEILR